MYDFRTCIFQPKMRNRNKCVITLVEINGFVNLEPESDQISVHITMLFVGLKPHTQRTEEKNRNRLHQT